MSELTKSQLRDKADRLAEIKDQITELLGEAADVLNGTYELEAAQAYWLAHIRIALDNDHFYLGGSMHTLQDTIDALEADDEEWDEAA